MRTELGTSMRDTITGFTGTVTGYAEYISGCNQALLAPKMKDDGSVPESQWFDIQRLARVGTAKIKLDNGKTPGCDRAAPKR
jgi:hypothetical protein